jgi:hypothetical protein
MISSLDTFKGHYNIRILELRRNKIKNTKGLENLP